MTFYKGVSGELWDAAAAGWSFGAPKGDPLYNHFYPGLDGKPGVAGVDDDNDGIIDEQDEWRGLVGGDYDLDPDGDGLGTVPNGIDYDGGFDPETQAWTAETIPQNTYRAIDWASPGKGAGRNKCYNPLKNRA